MASLVVFLLIEYGIRAHCPSPPTSGRCDERLPRLRPSSSTIDQSTPWFVTESPMDSKQAPLPSGSADDLRGKKVLQGGEVTGLCCGEERAHKAPMCDRAHRLASLNRDALAGASH